MKKGLAVKINAPILLERELSRRARRKQYGFIALSSSTEPWMYIEKEYEITKKCLLIIAKYRFPVHCLTKSPIILRDINVLKEIDKNAILPVDLRDKLKHGVLITFSFSTLDEDIRRIFEFNAPSIEERLNAIKELKDFGFYCGIAFMPLLPFITDSEKQIEEMVKVAKKLNVDYVFFGDLTLYGVGKNIYLRVIEKNFPELVKKYERLYKLGYRASREYRNRFYSRVMRICKKNDVKVGIL